MEETPTGTPVGVDDPYEFAGVCDHLTDDGRCRYALDAAGEDPAFAAARRADDYACVAADADCAFRDCTHYRSTAGDRECVRCGLEEVRMANDATRPLLEEHHLSYGSAGGHDAVAGDRPSHEITVTLCRWCHSKVHKSFARIDDEASPDPEAFAAREARRSKEQAEFGFASAAERRDADADPE
jgi:hypothetical protein